MAADKLDKLWDGWMTSLSASYQRTLTLLDSKDLKGAGNEFRTQFVPTVKKLYSEAASVYPVRFNKMDDWCSWTRQLYMLALKADKTLQSADEAASATALASLRDHFDVLHRKTQTQRVNDAVYAFRLAALSDQASVDELKKLRDAVEQAKPSAKAAADGDVFAAARVAWLGKIDPVLQDGQIDQAELALLREAAEEMYRAYGVQFE